MAARWFTGRNRDDGSNDRTMIRRIFKRRGERLWAMRGDPAAKLAERMAGLTRDRIPAVVERTFD